MIYQAVDILSTKIMFKTPMLRSDMLNVGSDILNVNAVANTDIDQKYSVLKILHHLGHVKDRQHLNRKCRRY